MGAKIYPVKFCRKCNEGRGAYRPLSAFYKDKDKRDGLTTVCRGCQLHYATSKPKRDRKQEKKAYYEANKERIKDRQRKYNRKNPEVGKRYRNKNKDRRREYFRAWCKREADRKRALEAKRRARKKAASGTITAAQLRMLFTMYKACLCCGASTDLTLDHIVPLSKGGSHTLHNSQVLCHSCNSGKRDYHSTDYRYIGIDEAPG